VSWLLPSADFANNVWQVLIRSKHIWAKRMKTSTAKWNAETEKWEWSRYATSVTGTLDEEIMADEEEAAARDRIRLEQTNQGLKIEWPLNKDTPNKTRE